MSQAGTSPKPVKVPPRPADRPGMPVSRAVLVPAALLVALAGSLTAAAAPATATAPATAQTAVASAAYTPTAADRRIKAKEAARATSKILGTHYSGTVIDVASNTVVWSRNGTVGRMPASTTKLITATNALNLYGPAYRFTTTVREDPQYVSRFHLVGSGDPSLSSADLSVLATSTAAAVKAKGLKEVRVYADDHIFVAPSLAPGWKRSYVPTDVRWVRALVVNRRHANDTSIDAAKVFAAQLKAKGVNVLYVARKTAPSNATLIGSVQGDRLDAIVKEMLLVSDNDHAEALHRLVARKAGYWTTWTRAGWAQRAVLARDGVAITENAMHDGSGLSRSDRLTTYQLARVVDNFLESGQSDLAVLRSGGLPLAGRTGTLEHRFVAEAACGRGKVWAKTGTLSDAVALAGYARGTDGRLKAFAFLVNGKDVTTSVRNRVDLLAATVTGCY